MTRTVLLGIVAAAALIVPAAVSAELPVGTKAPNFATQGALAGEPFGFNLAAALRKGPVVLYFYPKSFTQGCTLEAHAFSEAMDDFHKAGATVIGLSADDLETQKKFSTEHCRGKFPVAIATPAIIQAYQVQLKKPDGTVLPVTSRTSYVIGRDGRIRLAYTNMDYSDHVKLSLAAVQALKGKPRG